MLGFSFLFDTQWFTQKSSHWTAPLNWDFKVKFSAQTTDTELEWHSAWLLRTRHRGQVSKVKTQEMSSTHMSPCSTWRSRTADLCNWLLSVQATLLTKNISILVCPDTGSQSGFYRQAPDKSIRKEIWETAPQNYSHGNLVIDPATRHLLLFWWFWHRRNLTTFVVTKSQVIHDLPTDKSL